MPGKKGKTRQQSIAAAFKGRNPAASELEDGLVELCRVRVLPASKKFDLDRQRIEQFEERYFTTYVRHVATESEAKGESAANWCREGSKYVQALEDLNSSSVHFPGSVSKNLATIVFNHAQHTIPNMAQRALRLLESICDTQSPRVVTSGAGSQRHVLECPPEALELWVPLPKTVSSSELSIGARGSRSGAPAERTPLPEKYGVNLVKDVLGKVLDAIGQVARADVDNQPDVATALGNAMLLKYIVRTWERDLQARLQVVRARLCKEELERCRTLLRCTLLYRALEQGKEPQVVAIMQDSVLAAIRGARELLDDEESGSLSSDIVRMLELVRAAAGAFLRHVLALLGAMEDLGMGKSRTEAAIRRTSLDRAFHEHLSKCVKRGDPTREWRLLLHELEPRDCMRALSMFVICHHDGAGGTLLADVKRRFHGDIADEVPGTYLDVPPSQVLAFIATDAGRRVRLSILNRSSHLLTLLTYFLCTSAAQCLRQLVTERRFVLVPAGDGEQQLHPVASATVADARQQATIFSDPFARLALDPLSEEDVQELLAVEAKGLEVGIAQVEERLQELSQKRRSSSDSAVNGAAMTTLIAAARFFVQQKLG